MPSHHLINVPVHNNDLLLQFFNVDKEWKEWEADRREGWTGLARGPESALQGLQRPRLQPKSPVGCAVPQYQQSTLLSDLGYPLNPEPSTLPSQKPRGLRLQALEKSPGRAET